MKTYFGIMLTGIALATELVSATPSKRQTNNVAFILYDEENYSGEQLRITSPDAVCRMLLFYPMVKEALDTDLDFFP